jgi:spore germination cell wall hydrolase CwlJ-like protein
VGSVKTDKQTVIEMQDSVKKLVLLTKLIQSESGSESFLDKLLVGSVVLNWMKKKDQNIDTVIFHPNRFSGVHGKGFRETAESRRAAMLLLENGPIDTTILFFLNPAASTNRKWVRQVMQRELVTRTKNHYFYK